MNVPDTVQIMLAIGMVGLLWKIQRELGGISALCAYLKDRTDDHESRIRTIEGGHRHDGASRRDDQRAA